MRPVKRGDMLVVKWKNGESNFFTVKSINSSFVEYIDSEFQIWQIPASVLAAWFNEGMVEVVSCQGVK